VSGHDGAVPGCSHERGAITDSFFYGHMYATDVSRRIFCDVCRMQRWLDVEVALARTQAELGMIPSEAAEGIASAASIERLDHEWIRDEIRRIRHSLVPLLRSLQRACPPGAADFVHYGATTQDIQDTAQALEMRAVLDELDAGIDGLVEILVPLAREHAATLMIGRTHARPALPMTFGLKVASWIDELVRDAERLSALRPRVLALQLHGGVGTMATWGDRGPVLAERMAAQLGLAVPDMGWHVARDRIAEYVTSLAMVAGTLGRIADEVRTLSRPEFGELALSWFEGKVGSSTMPHKRNPEECQQIVVMARLAAAQVNPALQAMVVEHERDSRELRLEWAAVADVSHHTLAAVTILVDVMRGISVRPETMVANAAIKADEMASEALTFKLAERIGKQAAYDIVYANAQRAASEGRSLRELLAETGAVREHLTDEEVDRVFDPANHVGASTELIDRVLERADEWRVGRAGAALVS
jgi:adenylosuccinate lyase